MTDPRLMSDREADNASASTPSMRCDDPNHETWIHRLVADRECRAERVTRLECVLEEIRDALRRVAARYGPADSVGEALQGLDRVLARTLDVQQVRRHDD